MDFILAFNANVTWAIYAICAIFYIPSNIFDDAHCSFLTVISPSNRSMCLHLDGTLRFTSENEAIRVAISRSGQHLDLSPQLLKTLRTMALSIKASLITAIVLTILWLVSLAVLSRRWNVLKYIVMLMIHILLLYIIVTSAVYKPKVQDQLESSFKVAFGTAFCSALTHLIFMVLHHTLLITTNSAHGLSSIIQNWRIWLTSRNGGNVSYKDTASEETPTMSTDKGGKQTHFI